MICWPTIGTDRADPRFDEFVFRLDGAMLTACSETEPLSFPEACAIALDAIDGVVQFTAESVIEIASTGVFRGREHERRTVA